MVELAAKSSPATSRIKTRCSHSKPRICAAASATKAPTLLPVDAPVLMAPRVGADEDVLELLAHRKHRFGARERPSRERERAEGKAETKALKRRQVRGLLIPRRLEKLAVGRVKQRSLRQVPWHAERRLGAARVRIERNRDPVGAHCRAAEGEQIGVAGSRCAPRQAEKAETGDTSAGQGRTLHEPSLSRPPIQPRARDVDARLWGSRDPEPPSARTGR
jgi:hypothetical protein